MTKVVIIKIGWAQVIETSPAYTIYDKPAIFIDNIAVGEKRTLQEIFAEFIDKGYTIQKMDDTEYLAVKK
jgi:hypothetical protein